MDLFKNNMFLAFGILIFAEASHAYNCYSDSVNGNVFCSNGCCGEEILKNRGCCETSQNDETDRTITWMIIGISVGLMATTGILFLALYCICSKKKVRRDQIVPSYATEVQAVYVPYYVNPPAYTPSVQRPNPLRQQNTMVDRQEQRQQVPNVPEGLQSAPPPSVALPRNRMTTPPPSAALPGNHMVV